MMKKKRKIPPDRKDFRIGDFVSFHTRIGYRTGIIELIEFRPGRHQVATITVKNGTFKPVKYRRPLYKLRHID